MKKLDLTSDKKYWLKKIQIELYNELLDYIQANKLTQNEIAVKLGVTKGYVSKLLNEQIDHKISKLIDLAFFIGKVPVINYPQLVNYKKKEEGGTMLPYKVFEYYSLKDPNTLKDEKFHTEPNLKINMKWFENIHSDLTLNVSPNQTAEFDIKEYGYESNY